MMNRFFDNHLFFIFSQLNELKINEFFKQIFDKLKSHLQFDNFRGELAVDLIKIATKRWAAFTVAMKISTGQQLQISEINSSALLKIFIGIAHPDLPFYAVLLWTTSPLGNPSGFRSIMSLNRNKG